MTYSTLVKTVNGAVDDLFKAEVISGLAHLPPPLAFPFLSAELESR